MGDFVDVKDDYDYDESSNLQQQQVDENRLFADFKMVTFSLGGKEYGVDIMRVKEISKVKDFTHVPNASPYVRGVYNLRGEIISVIDLRLMFNLEPLKREDGLENMIVVNHEDHVSGIVVDSIDRVVAVSSKTIQDPHPIFSNINISFMKGVVEFNEQLYVILNMDRIMRKKVSVQENKAVISNTADSFSMGMQPFAKPLSNSNMSYGSENFYQEPPRPVARAQAPSRPVQEVQARPAPVKKVEEAPQVRYERRAEPEVARARGGLLRRAETVDAVPVSAPVVEPEPVQSNNSSQLRDKIVDLLSSKSEVIVSGVNKDWIDARADVYAKKGLGAKDITDVDEFLTGFFSASTDKLWDDDLVDSLIKSMSHISSESIYAWNPGCNQGYEAYSVITALKEAFPSNIIKLWANDVDLINVSMAPTLSFSDDEVSSIYKDYMHEEKSGLRFTPEISNLILFEYHDIIHENPYPPMDLIVARDLLSFIEESSQAKVLADFEKLLKPGGLLVLGDNEKISSIVLKKVENEYLNIYKKDV
ncbi:MAG: chemotaxis protein CheW [Spirochaetales bacterium]|nr:chemotaxis protein CheW [Spirochaetales bacterium]